MLWYYMMVIIIFSRYSRAQNWEKKILSAFSVWWLCLSEVQSNFCDCHKSFSRKSCYVGDSLALYSSNTAVQQWSEQTEICFYLTKNIRISNYNIAELNYFSSQNSCRAGHASTCSILIKQGNADVQARSPVNGYVSMHEAAIEGRDECVKCLIEHDAPLHPRSLEGDTPRDLALRLGHTHVVELIDNYPTPPPRYPSKMWLHEHVDRRVTVEVQF